MVCSNTNNLIKQIIASILNNLLDSGDGILNLTLYRAYSPQSGRWLSKDPIEEEGRSNDKVCEKCTDWACSYAPTYCCHADYRSCMAGAIDDPTVAAKCNAKLALCTLKSGGR